MGAEAAEKAWQTQIANIEKKTEKKMDQWMIIVNKSKLTRHGELVNFLIEKHGFTHGNANVVVHLAKKTHAGAAENSDDLVSAQYTGKENMKPWYDKIMKEVSKFGNDIQVAPKKAYVSLVRKKQFAIICPSTKTRMDVGLNLKGQPGDKIAEATTSWNAMCTHRIKIEDEKLLNKDLVNWIKKSYDKAG